MFPKYLLFCNWPRGSSLVHQHSQNNQNLTKETPVNPPLLKNLQALTNYPEKKKTFKENKYIWKNSRHGNRRNFVQSVFRV